jgi:hypothetical protein
MHAPDREPTVVTEARVGHIEGKIVTVKPQMRQLKRIGQQMSKAPDGQISLTDPDARSMATSGRGTGMVGGYVLIADDSSCFENPDQRFEVVSQHMQTHLRAPAGKCPMGVPVSGVEQIVVRVEHGNIKITDASLEFPCSSS